MNRKSRYSKRVDYSPLGLASQVEGLPVVVRSNLGSLECGELEAEEPVSESRLQTASRMSLCSRAFACRSAPGEG